MNELNTPKIGNIKQADITLQLKLSLSAAKSRIQRARQILKAEFITCCHFEPDTTDNIFSFDIKYN